MYCYDSRESYADEAYLDALKWPIIRCSIKGKKKDSNNQIYTQPDLSQRSGIP